MTSQVLLLKAADAAYAAAFERRTLVPHFVDVLAFDYVNAAALLDAVTHLEHFSALLVTSPRAAGAVARALLSLRDHGDDDAHITGDDRFESALRTLRAMPVYAVGRATSRELEALGVPCRGVECGSAEALAALVHREDELPAADARPALFACGEKRSAVLPESFRARGRPLQELEVYRSRKLESVQLPPALVPHWVAFFSPSGLKAMAQAPLPWAHVRKAAIGALSRCCSCLMSACRHSVVCGALRVASRENDGDRHARARRGDGLEPLGGGCRGPAADCRRARRRHRGLRANQVVGAFVVSASLAVQRRVLSACRHRFPPSSSSHLNAGERARDESGRRR